MNVPDELKYTKDHEWVRVEGESIVVGVTDFAQKELGDIVYVDVDSEGDTIEKEPMIFKSSLREDKSFEHFYFDYPKDC